MRTQSVLVLLVSGLMRQFKNSAEQDSTPSVEVLLCCPAVVTENFTYVILYSKSL